MILFDKEISDGHRVRPEVLRVLAVQIAVGEFEITRFQKMRTAEGRASGVRILDGVARWVSNNHVPPKDAVVYYGIDQLPGFDQDKTDWTREVDTDRFLSKYRAANANRAYSAEETAEMVNAYGPGVEVVNVITGKRTRLPGQRENDAR